MAEAKISKWRSESILDIYNFSFATFLFISPWLFAYKLEIAKIDIMASSVVVALTAISAILAYANWKEWLNIMLGGWLIASPWVLGFAHTRAMHFSIGIGIAVIFVAVTELLAVNYLPTPNPPSV